MSTALAAAQKRIERIAITSTWVAVSNHMNEQIRDSDAALLYRKVRAPVYGQVWEAMRCLVYEELRVQTKSRN